MTLDSQRRLCMDGQPFFALGLYSVRSAEDMKAAKDLGFNTVHTYAGEGSKEKEHSAATPETLLAYLEAAHKLGLKVYLGLPRYDVIHGKTAPLEARIRLLKDAPALLAWYLFDEPSYQKVSAAVIRSSADMLGKLDPRHPKILVECEIKKQERHFRKDKELFACPDILMTDPYPCKARDSDLSLVTGEIAFARLLVEDKKPVWNVVQLHGKGPGGTGWWLLEPNYAELRNMTFQSLVAGARGLTFFCYDAGEQFQLFKSPQGLENVKRVLSQVHELIPLLLSDEPSAPPLAVTKSEGLATKTFVHKGKLVLLAVNLRHTPVRITATAARMQLPAEIRVLFENRTIQAKGPEFSEELEPLAVRAYEMPAPAGNE